MLRPPRSSRWPLPGRMRAEARARELGEQHGALRVRWRVEQAARRPRSRCGAHEQPADDLAHRHTSGEDHRVSADRPGSTLTLELRVDDRQNLRHHQRRGGTLRSSRATISTWTSGASPPASDASCERADAIHERPACGRATSPSRAPVTTNAPTAIVYITTTSCNSPPAGVKAHRAMKAPRRRGSNHPSSPSPGRRAGLRAPPSHPACRLASTLSWSMLAASCCDNFKHALNAVRCSIAMASRSETFACRHGDRPRAGDRGRAPSARVVFVRRGCFVRRARGVHSLLDPTAAYCANPGEDQHFDHPHAGGDDCTADRRSPRRSPPDSGVTTSLPAGQLPHLAAARPRAPAAARLRPPRRRHPRAMLSGRSRWSRVHSSGVDPRPVAAGRPATIRARRAADRRRSRAACRRARIVPCPS